MHKTIDRRSFTAMGLCATAALPATSAPAEPQPKLQGAGIRGGKKTQVTMLLYPGTTMLDWVGPYEELSRVEGVEIILAGKSTDPMKNDSGIVEYRANVSLDHIEHPTCCSFLVAPRALLTAYNDPVIMDWIKRWIRATTYTVGVCTGALRLAHAGFLKGRHATTYWAFPHMLEQQGATFVQQRGCGMASIGHRPGCSRHGPDAGADRRPVWPEARHDGATRDRI